MTTILVQTLTLLLGLVGNLTGNASALGKIVQWLETLLPTIVQEVATVGPMVKDLIARLRGEAVTPDDLAKLDAAEAQIDAAFDAAAAAEGFPADPSIAVAPGSSGGS